MAVQYSEAHGFVLDLAETYRNRIDELFEELVPMTGKADSRAGELVRAVSRLGYRYYNAGEMLGLEYGIESCNLAGRFLDKYGDVNIKRSVDGLWKHISEESYEAFLQDLIRDTVDYIEAHPELKNEETEDMFDYFRPEYDYYYEEDEYE